MIVREWFLNRLNRNILIIYFPVNQFLTIFIDHFPGGFLINTLSTFIRNLMTLWFQEINNLKLTNIV
jgi:hypothetical protein